MHVLEVHLEARTKEHASGVAKCASKSVSPPDECIHPQDRVHP